MYEVDGGRQERGVGRGEGIGVRGLWCGDASMLVLFSGGVGLMGVLSL